MQSKGRKKKRDILSIEEKEGKKALRKGVSSGDGEKNLMTRLFVEDLFAVCDLTPDETVTLRRVFGFVGWGGSATFAEIAEERGLEERKVMEEFNSALRKLRGHAQWFDEISAMHGRKVVSLR
jgi:DNA-directed RNA polymerase sigma subunit (sigma70/sigma32)